MYFDEILDHFKCGKKIRRTSWPTAVACKEHNRKYLGFEINPDYYKIAVDRVNGITATGQTSIFTFLEN